MNHVSRRNRWTRQAVLSVAVLCVAASAARAQTTTAYSTGFDGTDTINGNATPTTYASPDFSAATPTAPLAGQNGWTSNDGTTGTVSATNPNQFNGGTTYVGTLSSTAGSFFNGTQAGAIGGLYGPASGQTPYAVPSTASGGIINLLHGVTIPSTTTQVVFNIDFAIIEANALAKDTFSFTLGSALTITFTPSATTNQFNITATGSTPGGGNNADAVVFNSQYHLKITLNPGATPTYAAVLTAGLGGGGTPSGITGTLATSLSSINQFVVGWNLADKTTNADGGLTGAGDNFIAFDNLSIAVPEPSTYAVMAVGLVGLAGVWRSRRQRA